MRLAIVCNDKIATRLVRYLYSARMFTPDLDITLIPFNENFSLCTGIAHVFGVKIFDVDQLARIDEFGRFYFDDNIPQLPYPYMLNKLRKLAMFSFAEPVLYMDVDTIFSSRFEPIATLLDTEDYGFAYYVRSPDWVYNDTAAGQALRERSELFSSGFLAKGAHAPDLDTLLAALRPLKSEYHAVRRQGVVDQPLLNFIADRVGVGGPTLNIQRKLDLSWAVTPTDKTVIHSDWTAWFEGAPIPFIHAAGEFKVDPRCRFLFDGMLVQGLETIGASDRPLLKRILELGSWE